MQRVCGLSPATLLAFLSGALRSAEAFCLPDAVPPEKRHGIATLTGDEVPFGIWVHDWDSARLAFHVVKVISEEVLGYNTVISGEGSSSNSGLYATAGCHEPNNFATDPKCGEDPTFVHHATLEVWGVSKIATMRQKLAPWPKVVPEDAGNMGYEGIQGTYVFKEQKEQAYQTEGLTLEYYRSYDANWTNPAAYFDKISAFDPADLRPCNETWFYDSEMMSIYLQVTGDHDGLVYQGNGTYIARCWNQSWWFAPACRNSPDSCVPFVTTYLGWFMHDFMQRAARFNMPLALSVAKSNVHWKRVARDMKCLTYWWEPDLTFIDLHPSIITFPAYNALERAANIRLSMSDNTRLSKWVHNQLGFLASRLREFLFRVSITKESVNEMLLKNTRGASHEQVACDWVAQNEHIWRAWVPMKTSCIPGKGLIAEDGAFVASRELADDCEWCPPGRFASQHNDQLGMTYVCVQCGAGRSQPNPGQLECGTCDPGTFAASNSSRECTRCPVGTFQNGTSATGCHECPATMTTMILGASTVSECICPEGTFRPAGSSLAQLCEPCPEGMECKVGSAEDNIPRARGATPGGEHPKPLPMFYATYSEPLSVYLCMNPGRCPGGGFEVCEEHSFGLACGHCEAGYHDGLNSGCEKCSAVARSWWIIPFVVLALVPLVACLLHKFSLAPLHTWGSPHNAVAAAGFLALAYLQIIAVVRTCYLLYPTLLADAIEWTSFSLEPLTPFHLDCPLDVDFQTRFVLQLLAPLVALFVFAATFASSRMLERCNKNYHMDGYVVMGCYGSLYNTFFISTASHAFQLFQCYEHPNGRKSLRLAPEVLCDSQTWEDLVLVAVIAILLFCGGALALYSYVNFKAPLHFKDEDFRKKWHFLFMRFRPTVWWWSTCLLLKGIWISLATVIFENGHLQLVWLTFAHLLYLVVCFALLPWRSMSICALDVGMHAVLLLVFALLPYFAYDGHSSFHQVMGVLSVACCASPLLGTCCVVATQLWYRFRPVSREEQAHEMCEIFSKASTRDVAAVLQLLPTADLWALDATRHMLEAELLGTRISTKRLTFRPSAGSNPLDASQSPPGTPRSTLSGMDHVKSAQSVHSAHSPRASTRVSHVVQLAV